MLLSHVITQLKKKVPFTAALVHRPHGRQGEFALAQDADGIAAGGVGHHRGGPQHATKGVAKGVAKRHNGREMVGWCWLLGDFLKRKQLEKYAHVNWCVFF